MPVRKQFNTSLQPSAELSRLLAEAKDQEVSEEELRELRVSFAFGNAPPSDRITKDSVRKASQRIRLK